MTSFTAKPLVPMAKCPQASPFPKVSLPPQAFAPTRPRREQMSCEETGMILWGGTTGETTPRRMLSS